MTGGLNKGAIQRMHHELLPIISQYEGNYISKRNIVDYLLEKPSPWVAGLHPTYRGRLITMTMTQQMGWRPYSGTKNKEVRSFVRK